MWASSLNGQLKNHSRSVVPLQKRGECTEMEAKTVTKKFFWTTFLFAMLLTCSKVSVKFSLTKI